jgi:bleomycin hydrolase
MRIIIFFLFLSSVALQAQNYQFSADINIACTPVISQGRTGTCWSFSTSSFLESEIIRLKGKPIDLSEMYTVRQIYPEKAENYIMRQGKAQFSQGGLAHDVLHSVSKYGLVPQSVYDGLDTNQTDHNHTEMVAILTAMLNRYIENPAKELSPKWKMAVSGVLDAYLGATVSEFEYGDTTFTPMSFLEMTGISPKDYITVTSFKQAPFYSTFILNIPDNFSNGSFYNVPLDELVEVTDNALKNGFSVELDVDVSEQTFSSKHGVAVVPSNDSDSKAILTEIKPEKQITQDYRQQEFENYNTTDDHLMHIVGTIKDQKGNTYYKVKNSWGTDANRNANGGYIYMSKAYFKLKAISVTVHKDALPKAIANKLNK